MHSPAGFPFLSFRDVAGRLLLASIATLIAVTPLMERVWDWDRFFRGGEDLELGLLSLAIALCLALLLCYQGKSTVLALITLRRPRLLDVSQQTDRPFLPLRDVVELHVQDMEPFGLPLQI